MSSEIDAYLIRLAPLKSDTLTIPNPVIFTNSITMSAAAGGKLAYTITAETASDPGRHMYLQRTYTGTMGAGKGLTGIEIRSTFNGAAAAATSEVKGGEFKARHTSGNAYDVGTFKGVIGNCDSKSGAKTITSAWAVEGQIDCGTGSTITTAAGIRVAYNEDGTVTNAYGVFVDGTSVWNVGVKITDSKTVTGIDVGTCTTGINLTGAMADGLIIGGAMSSNGVEISGVCSGNAINITNQVVTLFAGTIAMAGAAADNAMELTVTDAIAIASTSYTRGLYINYTNNGIKSANAECNGIGVDVNTTANVTSLYPISLYVGACAGATVNRTAAMYVYMDALTGTVGASSCMHLETVGGATYNSFISIRKHGGTLHAIISDKSGGATATNLLELETVAAPAEAFNAAGNGAYSIKCKINGVTTYLHTYDAP